MIVGKIYFLLVRIKIKHMEIDIIKRETTGTGPNVYHENDTIAKYEIMDGAPVRGEREQEPPGFLLWRLLGWECDSCSIFCVFSILFWWDQSRALI